MTLSHRRCCMNGKIVANRAVLLNASQVSLPSVATVTSWHGQKITDHYHQVLPHNFRSEMGVHCPRKGPSDPGQFARTHDLSDGFPLIGRNIHRASHSFGKSCICSGAPGSDRNCSCRIRCLCAPKSNYCRCHLRCFQNSPDDHNFVARVQLPCL